MLGVSTIRINKSNEDYFGRGIDFDGNHFSKQRKKISIKNSGVLRIEPSTDNREAQLN